MRADQKTLELEEEQVDARKREARARDHEGELEMTEGEVAHKDVYESEATADRYKRTLEVVEAIFRSKDRRGPGVMTPLDGLTGFSAIEMEALRMLEMAVKGRDPKHTHLVYAEDRRDLLEQALLVLYPNLAHGLDSRFDALREQHDRLVSQVVELRGEILQLEDAQEDLLDILQVRRMEEEEAKDDGDKDDDDSEVEPHEPVYRPEDDETRR
jgi:hypothetical protein